MLSVENATPLPGNSRVNREVSIRIPHNSVDRARTTQTRILNDEKPEQDAYRQLAKFSGALFLFVCCFMAIGFLISTGEHHSPQKLLSLGTPFPATKLNVPDKAQILSTNHSGGTVTTTNHTGEKNYLQEGVGFGTAKHADTNTRMEAQATNTEGKTTQITHEGGTVEHKQKSNTLAGLGTNPDTRFEENRITASPTTTTSKFVDGKLEKLDVQATGVEAVVHENEIHKNDGTQGTEKHMVGSGGISVTKIGDDFVARGDEKKNYNVQSNTGVFQKADYKDHMTSNGPVATLTGEERVNQTKTETAKTGKGQDFTSTKTRNVTETINTSGPPKLVEQAAMSTTSESSSESSESSESSKSSKSENTGKMGGKM